MSAIQEYLTGPDDPETLAQAAEIAARSGGVRRMYAALTDPLTCADVRPRLPELAQAYDVGLPLSSEMQALARHLTHCKSCAAELSELQALSRQAEIAPVSQVAIPEPDLSFLQPAPPAVALLWEQLDAVRRQFAADIRIAIRGTAAQFRGLPAGLAPQPVAIPVLRDAAAGAAAQRLALPPAPGNLAVELTVSAAVEPAQVIVRLAHADSGQPRAQVVVTLLNADRQRLRRANTDAAGRVVFAGLLPGRYYLQARSADGQWELALVLAADDSTA